MEVGESFFIPTLKPSSIIFSSEEGAKRCGIRVKTFVSSKDGKLGVRVWRIR